MREAKHNVCFRVFQEECFLHSFGTRRSLLTPPISLFVRLSGGIQRLFSRDHQLLARSQMKGPRNIVGVHVRIYERHNAICMGKPILRGGKTEIQGFTYGIGGLKRTDSPSNTLDDRLHGTCKMLRWCLNVLEKIVVKHLLKSLKMPTSRRRRLRESIRGKRLRFWQSDD
ncbi:hypothetical protein TNCV_3071981 [Trichonephila clavipes]|nr:hypothetical protein TNCV_3071981 [Trichonephila clavipes]